MDHPPDPRDAHRAKHRPGRAVLILAVPMLVGLVLVGRLGVVEVDHVGGIHHVVRAVVADHLVDRRLQPLLVEHDIRRRDLRRLAR